MSFVIAGVATGKLNAMVKNMMKTMAISVPNEAVRRINSSEWVVVESPPVVSVDDVLTVDDEGIAYITLSASTGKSGVAWARHIERTQADLNLLDPLLDVLKSAGNGTIGIVHKVAIIPCSFFPVKKEEPWRTTSIVQSEVERRGWLHGKDVPAEVACLLLETLNELDLKELMLHETLPPNIIVMHDDIEGMNLSLNETMSENTAGYKLSCSEFVNYEGSWGTVAGFACVVPE